MADRHLIAVEPETRPAMHEVMVAAVEEAGGTIVPIERASALMFADPMAAGAFRGILDAGVNVEWIQLPYAGIETFAHNLDADHLWTCGKGAYAAPVAEWILTAILTSFRAIPRYVRSTSWQSQEGRDLRGAKLTILGGGGITDAFMKLIAPFECEVTVVRRSDTPYPGASHTMSTGDLHNAISDAVDAIPGAASAPLPAHHCHPALLLAKSASTRQSQNHCIPWRQCSRRFLTKKEATIIRTRLCIEPVCQSSRMPASTIG